MLNTPLSQTWVKNVYSMGIVQGITIGKIFTATRTYIHKHINPRVKPQLFNHFIDTFTPYLFTRYFKEFHLLIERLYTVSTAPTITKMKEKKERNS